MLHNAPDEGLLGREVVMDGRDVDPGPSGDVARPQALEAALGNLVERGLNQFLTPFLLPQSGLIKQLIDFARRLRKMDQV